MLSATEVRIAIAAFIAGLVARFDALLPGYSLDDYVPMLVGHDLQRLREPLIAQGRFLTYLVRLGLTKIDVQPPASGVLGCLVLTAVLVGMGLLITRWWGIDKSPAASLVAVLIVVLHPYQTEIFTFRVSTIVAAIAFSLAFIALNFRTPSWSRWVLGVGLFTAGLLMYQVVLNYAAMALLFSALFYLAQNEDRRANLWEHLKWQCGAIVAALVLYVVTAGAVAFVLRIGMHDRAAFLPLSQVGARINLAVRQLYTIFASTEPVLPITTKALLLVIPVVWLGGWLIAQHRAGRSNWRTPALLFATGLIGFPMVLGIVLVLKEWWPVPRVVSQIGIFWAGIVAFCMIHSGPLLRRILAGIAAVVMLSFIGVNNHILLDQQRLNMRDQAKANRIVTRLEALPDFSQLQGIVLSGGTWGYPLDFRTMQGDLNVSALYAAWSKVAVVNEVSGYGFQEAPDAVTAAAKEYCTGARAWPAAESVASIQSFGVVCLSK